MHWSDFLAECFLAIITTVQRAAGVWRAILVDQLHSDHCVLDALCPQLEWRENKWSLVVWGTQVVFLTSTQG